MEGKETGKIGAPSPCTSQVNIVINGHLLPGIINGLMASTTSVPPSPSHVTTKEGDPIKAPKVRLTPDQREMIKLEKEKARLERERLKAEAREKKEAEKRAKAEERERVKRERLAKKEKEEREKQERLASKQAEQERKLKEKEEQKRLKEKEKEDKDKLAAAEKLKAKERFLGFFQKPPKQQSRPVEVAEQAKSVSPMDSSQLLSFEELIRSQVVDSDYLQACKHTRHQISKRQRRENRKSVEVDNAQVSVMGNITNKNDELIVINDSTNVVQGRYKLLQFHENHRPAYFGTWSKSSKVLTPRNPFKKDNDLFDYDCESDLEWEEEEPGESLSAQSDDEVESGDEEEEEDGFFVPHGYLSDGEGDQSEDEKDKREEKNLAKAKAWEAEFSRQFKKLVPVKVGVVWSSSVVDENSKSILESFSAIPLVQLPIKITESQPVAKVSASTSKKLGKRCHDEITTPTMKSLKDFFKSSLSDSKRDNGNVARCLDLTPTQPKRPKLTTPILENATPTNVILIDESDSKENIAVWCGNNKDTPSSDERVEIVPNSEERMEISDSKDCKDEGKDCKDGSKDYKDGSKELQKIDWNKCLAVSQQLTVPVDCHL
ncbi:PREDICTED: chromatin assembly factor 1 subunit A-like [Amphimedon queenslandica]|uniref:Chromatin assembly factor 1 subunit p150 C-terminal domain-containing protein n=1 Tax=Amphimedon queenslandica TaxID=400682 RepID=A0A1X7U6K2_AMPQE|nr:PREDICTED: chromatin assembly factor 1 subunit A-like [Amphimedon queenslandica]|eukprot:XP_019855910.1 PREDICTED: chromatin assembly factor 1 subunit A-like [Amphimedon queenslandica]